MTNNETTDAATPGSRAALNIGCKCPVIDNHRGKGKLFTKKMDYDGNISECELRQFWINEDCPLHGGKTA